jgi:WD40 repeat protein
MTLEYASPEQMREERITPASDVYSLGVLLYELLTGEHPHDLQNRPLHEVMRVVCDDDPQPPSAKAGRVETKIESETAKLRRQLRGDLDNIDLMALRKEANRRYATVEQLSEDITRHLNGQPVRARGDGIAYRAGKFVRRNKTGVAVAATMFIALIIAALFVQWEGHEQWRALYAREMQEALGDWENNDIAGLNEKLELFIPRGRWEEDLRGFEWRYLWRLGYRELATLRYEEQADHRFGMFTSRWIGTFTDDGWYYIWDKETFQLVAKLSLPLTHIDERLMVGAAITGGHTVKIVDLSTENLRRSFSDPSAQITTVRFFDGMERAVTGHDDGTVKFWDVAAGRVVDTLQIRQGRILSLQFNRDRSRMLVWTDNRVLQLWDVGGKRVLRTFELKYDLGSRLWSTGNQLLFLLKTADDTVELYDMATGRNVAKVVDPGNRINFAEVSRGRFFVIGGEDKTAKLYEMPSLRHIGTFTGHTEGVTYADIAPDGKIMATAGADRTIRLWEIATQRELDIIKGHSNGIYNVRFFPDNRKLISSGDDRAVKIWDVAEALEPESLTSYTGRIFSVAFSPDGRMIATANQDRTIKLWDTQTDQAPKTFEGHPGQVFCVAFSPEGQQLVSSGEGTTAFVWNVNTGQILHRLTGHGVQIHSVTFSPDGRLIATGCDDRNIRLWRDRHTCSGRIEIRKRRAICPAAIAGKIATPRPGLQSCISPKLP